jgi:hypothetical protein
MTAQRVANRLMSTMAPVDMTASSARATRWGLAAKLFAILTLLGGSPCS